MIRILRVAPVFAATAAAGAGPLSGGSNQAGLVPGRRMAGRMRVHEG